MEILGLGHSSFLATIDPAGADRPLRLLVDPWLDDWLIGDLIGRYPRVRLDARAVGPVDAIWLSHSHTDHLCPYSLTRLWRELDPKPALLLPQSLRFLSPLLREHLPDGDLRFLEEGVPQDLGGLEVEAFFNPELRPTNEDDVMVLVVRGDREVLVAESDALLPFYDPVTRELLAEILAGPGIESACFVTIRNEGEATMSVLSASDRPDRDRRIGASLERTYEEVWQVLGEAEGAEADPWSSDRVVRLVAGQGIAYPQSLDPTRNRALFPIRVEDRVRIEREVAGQCGHPLTIDELRAGEALTIEAGRIASRRPAAEVEVLDREEDRRFDPEAPLLDDFPTAPLFAAPCAREAFEPRLDELLNARFLPWWIGAREPPVEHILAANGGEYRIRLRFGDGSRHEDLDWVSSFAALRFTPRPPEGVADEHYWASDLEAFLDGRCDEFSVFIRKPLGGRAQRLWLALGLPYLNGDLVERKLRLHFERARRGETLESWALPFHRAGGA